MPLTPTLTQPARGLGLLLALVGLLGACTTSTPVAIATAPTAGTVTAATATAVPAATAIPPATAVAAPTAVPATPAAPAATAAPAPSASPSSPAPTDFEGTWLRVNGLGEHDFGTSTDVVLASIEQVFGPPDEVFEATECGAGPMTITSFDDFSVQFQEGGLIGWFYTSSSPSLTTPSGVAPGISEAELTQVYEGVEIGDDTLGKEFFFQVPAGYIGGFFADTGTTVTELYAGTNCFFR